MLKKVVLFCLLIVQAIAWAQPQSESKVVNGVSYCVHKIQQGETLYALSRLYKVSVSDIKAANPAAGDALSLGQAVLIPCKSAPVSKPAVSAVPDEFKGNFIFHTVVASETVYSLCKKYKVTREQFNKDNPEVEVEGLKIGSVVKIYKADETAENQILIQQFLNVEHDSSHNHFSPDSLVLKDSSFMHIALMLPFQFERNKEFMGQSSEGQQPKLFKETRRFLELYQGAKMALDSLRKQGANVQLFVYDTKADTNEIARIIGKPEFQNIDLVIGPAYTHTFIYAAKKLSGRGIPLISPVSTREEVIKHQPTCVRVLPSEENHFKAIANFVGKHHLDANIIIAYEDASDEKDARYIQGALMGKLLMVDSLADRVPKLAMGEFKVLEKLSTTQKNVIIFANNKEGFSSKLTTRLYTKRNRYDIEVFATEKLKDYKNIEVEYWDSLNIHISGSYDIKYGSPEVDTFLTQYFEQYYAEPSKFALIGFDVAYLFGQVLLENGYYAHTLIAGKTKAGVMRDYIFRYNGASNGLSNQCVYLYRMENYQFVRVYE